MTQTATQATQANLGDKIFENQKWLKEQAEFQEWINKETEKSEQRCTSIMYQASFAILRERISFKIGSRQVDLSFKLADLDFFRNQNSLQIFATKEAEDFVTWLNKHGLHYTIETIENSEPVKSKAEVSKPVNSDAKKEELAGIEAHINGNGPLSPVSTLVNNEVIRIVPQSTK